MRQLKPFNGLNSMVFQDNFTRQFMNYSRETSIFSYFRRKQMEDYPHNMFYGAPPIIHKQAKELRRRETKAEKILWSFLSNKKLKVKFRRQHPINQFIVDFYCHELKLVIEADGEIHDKNEQREYDQMRNEHLEKLGLEIMRLKNTAIFETPEEVVTRIQTKVEILKKNILPK